MHSLEPLVRMRGMSKRYDGVEVLRDVDIDIRGGEVLVLAGENGAGKSTLVRLLCGAVEPESGSIEIGGALVRLRSPRDAAACGIAVIHQELPLVGALSVAENLSLGRERGAWVSPRALRPAARAAMRAVDPTLDIDSTVEALPVASRQLVAIARALHGDARVVIMDEPTSALDVPETARLLDIVRSLAARGVGVVYISHRMEEITNIADRVAVLRDGRNAGMMTRAELTPERLIRAMVGREITQLYPARTTQIGGDLLVVDGLDVTVEHGGLQVRDVSFSVRRGEIVGVVGLEGSGRSELLAALYGAYGSRATMRMMIEGRSVRIRSPRAALRWGMAYVAGDRATLGAIRDASIAENVMLASNVMRSMFGWVSPGGLRRAAEPHATSVGLRPRRFDDAIATLSGGNQQKALLARARAVAPKILLLDDPTRGVDVAVKHDVYRLMNTWTDDGGAIMLASSDLEEVLAMADRILVMHRGRCVAQLAHSGATADEVMKAAMGNGKWEMVNVKG